MSHYQEENYITMQNDLGLPPDNLPKGQAPIWIKPPKKATRLDMLEQVARIPEIQNCPDVMVLMYLGKNDRTTDWCDQDTATRAESWCRERGWKLYEPNSVYGCEAKVVVLLDCLVYPEFITRGINLLVIVTNNR